MAKKSNLFTDADLQRMGYMPDPNNPNEYIKMIKFAVEGERLLQVKQEEKTFAEVDARFFKNMNHEEITNTYRGGINGLFIPYDVPSFKNGKHLFVKQTNDGRSIPGSGDSDIVRGYKSATKKYFETHKETFEKMITGKNFPIRIQFFFIRRSAQEFDYNNISQMICDLMRDYKWLPDDSCKYLIPNFDQGYAIDKFNPGVILKIL